MADRKVTIAVETKADTKPLDDASKSVEELSKKNEESAKAGDKAKNGGLNAAKGFAAMGQAAAASNGSIGGLASALGNMAQQLPALAGAAGPIGLAIAAFMSWKKVVDSVKESQESMAKGLRDTAAGNAEARIKSLAKAYEDLKDSIADAADEAQRYFDAESSKDDAQTKADLAALELEKAQRKAALDPSDTFGGRRLDLDMAGRRAAIEDAAAQRKADRELAALRAQASAAQAAKAAAAEQQGGLSSEYDDLANQFANTKTAAQSKSASVSWWNGGSMRREAIWEKANTELERIVAAMKSVSGQMDEAADTMRQADREQYTLSQQEEVNLINRDTLDISRRTGAVTRGKETADYSRDFEADRLSRQRQEAERQAALQEQRMSRAEATRGVTDAERNLRNARNAGAGSSEVNALKAELEQARQARAEADRIIIENARQQAAQAAATAAAVKDIQARAARPGSGG